MKNYIAFAKGLVIFFVISHIFGYLLSTLQTAFIVKEVRKTQKTPAAKRKGSNKNDTD
jgi:hypothetical protein